MKSKLEQLLRKQEELKAQIHQEKNKLDQQERKNDTRRKIILGSLMMDMMKKGELDEKKIRKKLDGFLTKEIDHKFFDLSVKNQRKVNREFLILPGLDFLKLDLLTKELSV